MEVASSHQHFSAEVPFDLQLVHLEEYGALLRNLVTLVGTCSAHQDEENLALRGTIYSESQYVLDKLLEYDNHPTHSEEAKDRVRSLYQEFRQGSLRMDPRHALTTLAAWESREPDPGYADTFYAALERARERGALLGRVIT